MTRTPKDALPEAVAAPADASAPIPAPLPSNASLLVVATVAITVEAFLVPYARHFRSLGWRVDVACHDAASSELLREAFDNVYELPLSRSLLDVGGLVRGKSAVSKVLASQPDIVHVHTPIAGFVTRWAVRDMAAGRRPAIAYTAHGFHFHDGGSRLTNGLFIGVEKLAGRWTDRLIVINDEDEAAARRHHIVPRAHLIHMPGIGVDTAHYLRSRVPAADVRGVRERLGIAAGVPVLVSVAELSRRKRPQDPVSALAAMKHREAHLVMVGVGPEREATEELAERLGVAARVHFYGFTPDVRPVLLNATGLILSSSREGLARSVMEALSLEVPVIASAARGNGEMVGDDAGTIYEIGDVAALSAAMDRLLEEPEVARTMGVRGRARMVERFDLQPLIRMHESLYADLLADRRHGSK
jgi:glycosyltransferase involved in cell wall biosynthesis